MEEEKKKVKKGKENDELYAFLAAFLSIVGFVIALVAWKDNKYVMYYAKQSLVIFIIGFVAGILQNIFSLIAGIGVLISAALGFIVFLAWVLSWFYALSGEEKGVPIVIDWAKKINL